MTGTVTPPSVRGSDGRLTRVAGPAKATLRRQLLGARAALPAPVLEERSAALLRVVTETSLFGVARCLAAYVSIGTEPGTGPLLEHLRATGVRVLLPVLAADGPLDWAFDEGAGRRRPGPYGLSEPTGPRLGPARIAIADLVVVPALAVDMVGNRLGRGGGSYDRALALVPSGTPVLAVVYAEEVLDAVPVEPHDRLVTGALTPRGLLRFDLPRRP
jgi:5-formyltetrahydrofolate cyclo-ligase